jgi:hypothetical protein
VTTNIEFIRPQTLDTGEIYLYRERNYHGLRQTTTEVRFVNYTPCPAVVIIKHRNGSKQRCLREDLFEFKYAVRYQAAWIELMPLVCRYATFVKIRLVHVYQSIRIALLNPTS